MGNSGTDPALPDPAQMPFTPSSPGGPPPDLVVVPSHIETRSWIDALTPDHCVLVYTERFDDGRVFSLGRQIRIASFSGRLIAAGEFLPDQLDSLARCGFSHHLPLSSLADGSAGAVLENLVALPWPDGPDHPGDHFTPENDMSSSTP